MSTSDDGANVRVSENSTQLRDHLRKTLPDFMIPGLFLTVDNWPTLPNGKVDRTALARLQSPVVARGETDLVQPEGELERTIAKVWSEVLDVEQVGRHDNFFELGGDSILAIQIVSRSNRSGVRIDVRKLFGNPTVAELAAVVHAEGDGPSERGADTVAGSSAANGWDTKDPRTSELGDRGNQGIVPLTPIQRWFFDREPRRPERFSQWVRIEVSSTVTVGQLQIAIDALIERHEALRTCFRETGTSDGTEWTSMVGAEPSPVRVRQLSLEGMDDDQVRRTIAKEAESLQRDLDLERGELVGCELLDRGENGRTLLMVIHHLVVDGVSWRILVDDLNVALEQLLAGEPVALGPGSTSFAEWASRLQEYAESSETVEQREMWRAIAERSREALPRDHDLGPNSEESTRMCVRELDAELTRSLLEGGPLSGVGVRVGIDEILLAALGDTLSLWSGRPEVAVEVEIHGREQILDDIDLSRTVGWFTATYPILLPGGSDDPVEPLRILRQRRDALPHKGIGYGLLRHRAPGSGAGGSVELNHGAEVGFNYLGQWSGARDARSGAAVALKGAVGSSFDPRMLRPHPIEVSAAVVDGKLRIDWEFSENLHHPATIEQLATRYVGALRRFVAHRRGDQSADWAPSYYPLARVDAEVLRRLAARDGSIEDIYPLSPLQQGMLFHSVTSPTMYCHQAYLDLTGRIDDGDLELAWRRAVDRNPSLRSSILNEGLDEPLQVVRRGIDVPVRREDWTAFGQEQQQEKLRVLLAEDLGDGFDLEAGPLLRLSILRLSSDRVRVAFTGHHIIFDRWSFDALVDEVMADLEAIQRGALAVVPTRRPYRDFIAWLGAQDMAAAEEYWRHRLAGFEEPTPVPEMQGPRGNTRHVEGGTGEYQLMLDRDGTRALTDWARRSGITLNTALQGAWALLLAGYGRRDDVVFGATTSGRPTSLLGAQDMVGLFINTLPVRVRVRDEALVTPWLRDLQAEEAESRTYEFTPLYDIQRWSPVSGDRQLLETLLVFENSSWKASSGPSQIEVATFAVASGVNYPLAVVVEPGAYLNVFLSYDRTLFTEAAVARVAANLRTLLESLPLHGESTLKDLIRLLDVEVSGEDEPTPEPAPATLQDVAPESPAELELLDLWEQVLGVRPSSVEASFYEIGGHSLLALRLAERANQLFGVEISLIDLFKEPTVRSMARLLTGGGDSVQSPLVRIQQGDLGTEPLVGIHPGNGSVRCYRRLAQLLDPGRPVYGMQDIWASRESTPWKTIEEMAAAYVAELRSAVPDGPYHLVGYSFGGWVAYEMARQLDAAGERVGLLGLIDTAVPDLFRNVDMDDDPQFLAVLLRDLLHGSKRLEGLDLPGDLAGTDTESPLDRFVSIAWPHSAEERDAGRSWIGQAVALYKREVEMAARYRPGPYERTLRLFRAQEPPDQVLVPADETFGDPKFGWGAYCSAISVCWLPGDHGRLMFPPALDALADEINDTLGIL